MSTSSRVDREDDGAGSVWTSRPSLPAISSVRRSSDIEMSFGERSIAAAGAAVLSAVLVNPLDVVKTRLQAQAAGVPYYPYEPSVRRHIVSLGSSTYKGTLDVFHKIIRQEGFSKLWRGTNAALALAIPTVGIYLPCYDIFRNWSEDFTTKNIPVLPRRSQEAKKKHWRAGEFPGVSEGSTAESRATLIKNVKKKVDDKETAKAWVSTVTESLAERIQKKDWEGALEVFEMLKEQPFYTPKEGTYMKLLVLLGRSGQPAAAQKLFNDMLSEGVEASSELYTALLSAYSRAHLVDEALSLLSTMKSLGPHCHPDAFTYSALLKACSESSRFDLVHTLTQDMVARGVPTNTVTQNAILSGFGRAGRFDDVERVLVGMLESSSSSGSGSPDVWTMNIILSLFSHKIELMERWYEKFRAFGIEPETRTFNLLIGAYAKKGLFDKMAAVLEHMRRASFSWTTATYNNVIEALGRAGQVQEMEWAWEQMRAERMRPDTKTFCGLIEGYSKAGMFHKVVDVVKMAGLAEVPTTTTFFNAVMAACAQAEDLVEMERVFMRMKEAGRQPDDDTYTILSEAFAKEGMTDRIFELEQQRARAEVGIKNGGALAPLQLQR